MTRPLFEQYKEALRRGHLAARAGQVDEALTAYAAAATIAPDRAAPHTSSAAVLHAAGRRDEALVAFDRALDVAPDDEATLRARAQVFLDMGRLASAAADFEQLAESLEAAGRRDDALAPARRAVELTATAARRRLLDRLERPEIDGPLPPRTTVGQRRIGASQPIPRSEPRPRPAPPIEAEPEEPTEGVAAGTDAVGVPDVGATPDVVEPVDLAEEPGSAPWEPVVAAPEPAMEAEPVVGPGEELGDADEPAASTEAEPAEAWAGVETDAEPEAEPAAVEPAEEPAAAAVVADEPVPAEAPAPPPAPADLDEPLRPLIKLDEDEGPEIEWPAIDLPSAPPPPIVGPPPDAQVLVAEANALIDAGDPGGARNPLLTAVMVHRAAGRSDAALDVCLQLLALSPGDPHVHLAIAGLQLDRGWRGLATEKIDLLLRLTALTGDTQAEADVRALAAERVRDEPPAGYARA